MSKLASNLDPVEVLEGLIELRPFPETASRLLAACNEGASARKISQIIGCDPVLSIRLLQMANSPLFGFAGEIRTVEHASVVLGLRALKNLATSLAMGKVFGNGEAGTVGFRQKLWSHALACGSISRTLALTTRLASPDEAFISGVVHDVGKLLLTDYRPREYMTLYEASSGNDFVSLEQQSFGLAHTSVGRKCSESWGLPDEVNDVISFHHNPQDADFGGGLVDIVSVGNRLTRIWDPLESIHPELNVQEILREINIDMSPLEIIALEERAVLELSLVREVYNNS